MIDKIFNSTAILLLKAAQRLHLPYNEVNVIFYYGIIPLTWCILADIILGYIILTPLFVLLCTGIYLIKRKKFSAWCDKIFVLSQKFLLFFGEYKASSVIICVLVPIMIYVVLIVMLIMKFTSL